MSDTNRPYDPNAPEGDSGSGGAYISKRDLRFMLIGVPILFAALIPVYKVLERNSQKARCAQNMKAISSALSQYATLHDDRFPPIMRTQLNGAPDLGESGLPYTWASDIQEFMTPRSNFQCPSATPEETVLIEGRENSKIPSTYGMYVPYGGYLRSIIDNPDQTLLISETSNYGSADSYNPVPYTGMDGKVVPQDGFAIGWSDGNGSATGTSSFVTRLAFPGSKGGNFVKDGPARHDAGLHALNATGAAMPLLRPQNAKLERRYKGDVPNGMWAVPPVSRRGIQ